MDERISSLKDTVLELIINIINRIDDISNEYSATGNTDNERLINLFDDMHALADGIDIIKIAYPDLDLLEFQEKAEMMRNALEVQDMMLLFDILRFELKDLFLYWEQNLSKLN